MGADISSDTPSSFAGYDRIAAQYRECVIRCQQANDQLRACEFELRSFTGHDKLPLEPTDFINDMSLNVGRLSRREMEVFTHIGCGLTSQQIVDRLSVSMSTVETYRERLKIKLNIPTGAILTRQAVLWFNRD